MRQGLARFWEGTGLLHQMRGETWLVEIFGKPQCVVDCFLVKRGHGEISQIP